MLARSSKSPVAFGVNGTGTTASSSSPNAMSFVATTSPSPVEFTGTRRTVSFALSPFSPWPRTRTVTGSSSFTNATSCVSRLPTMMSRGDVMPTP